MERVLDDAADHLRREVGEPRRKGRGEGVEVDALVLSEAARRDHFPDVGVGRLRGEGGAGAEEDREEAVTGVVNCPFQGRVSIAIIRVYIGAVSDEQY